MILLRALTKSFGSRTVLGGFDLRVQPGLVSLLVGANGAGKTTTLRLIAGLSDADGGDIVVGHHDLRQARALALAQLSYLPQAPRFQVRLTCAQVVGFYAALRGRPSALVAPTLQTWGLADHADVPTGKLSGGLRQRLGLAVFALANAPVLLLDEPGLSLDPLWRERLQTFLVAEAARGKTVLVATHLLGEWEGRADRCHLLDGGRSGGDLPPDRLRACFPGLPEAAASATVPAWSRAA